MTHLDALCHASYQGKWYNGFVLAEGFSDQAGCSKLGTEAVKQGIVTRGILVRHDPLEEPVAAAGGARLRRGPRSLGTADRPEGVAWRRAVRLQRAGAAWPGQPEWARLNQWEFLLVIAPPNVPGSTGELVNPLAMF